MRISLRATLILLMITTAGVGDVPSEKPELERVTANTDEIDDYILAEMKKRRIPGLALGVVRNGKLIKASGYGLASMELAIPATPKTSLRLASITKQFTAAAIMLLVQERQLALDDRIVGYLGDVPETWNAITVKHLLTHTSGFTDRVWYGAEVDRLSFFSQPPDFAPGERWVYSDINYVLLGVIIEMVTKKSYREYLTEQFFIPLGMTASTAVTIYAPTYRLYNGRLHRAVWPPAEGGVISNVEDLAKWEAALVAQKILNKSSLEQMWTPLQLNDGSYYGYGFGWTVKGVGTRRTIGHGGRLGHYYLRLPEHGLAVIVLSNLPIEDGSSPLTLARGVARRYLPDVWPRLGSLPVQPDTNPQMTERIREVLAQIMSDGNDSSPLTPEFRATLHPNRRIYIVPRWITERDLSFLTFIACEDPHEGEMERLGVRITHICHYKLIHPMEVRYFSVSFTQGGKIADLESSTE